MNREALDRGCERSILALVLAALMFGPLAMGAVETLPNLIVQGLLMGAMLVWGVRMFASPKPQLFWPPISWAIAAFTGLAIARYFMADIEYVARQELIQVLLCAFLFFVVANNLYRQEHAQTISFALIFLGLGIAGYAVYQFYAHSNRVWNFVTPYLGRGTGTYISPNNLAGLLEMLIPLAVAYALAGRMKVVTRILLVYAALVMMAGLAVTFSRGGWVACAVGLIFLFGLMLTQKSHRLSALLALAALLAIGTVFVAQNLSKTASYIKRTEIKNSNNEIDLDLRGSIWQAAGRMWQDNVWLGVGPGHFNYRFREYRPEKMQSQPNRAHNDYLNLLADWGIAGGGIVLAGIGLFGAGLLKTWRYVKRPENGFGGSRSNRFAFFAGATSALAALAAHSMIDFNLHIPANAFIGIALLALLSANLRFATDSCRFNLRLPLKIAAATILAAGLGYLGIQEFRRANEYRWLAQAEKLPVYSYERAEAWEKAFAADPMNFTTSYNIGEVYRIRSFEGGDNYVELAKTAMDWYARGIRLNHYDGYNYLRTGMCLDWLERSSEAISFYEQAEALDPNGYFTAANIGWHHMQTGDYAAARSWLERSLRLQWLDNPIAAANLKITEQKLADFAAGKGRFMP